MKYFLIIVLLLISLIGIFFYNKNDGKIKETNQPFKIIAFGDSLTEGYGVKPEESYPAILEVYLKEENPNIEVVNMGLSGETTTEGLARIDSVISQNPQLVLLGLGANDMLRSTDTEITKANLEKMIITFKENNILVVLMGVEAQINNSPSFRKKFNAIYKDLAKKHDVAIVPFFLKNVVLVRSLNVDGIHPNAEGYEKIVEENVLPVVRDVLR